MIRSKIGEAAEFSLTATWMLVTVGFILAMYTVQRIAGRR